MTFNDIFKSSFLEKAVEFSILDVTIAMLLSFVIGLFIFYVYKKTFAEMLWDFFVEIFDYIFKKLYIEGKTTIKRMKNTSVFKFVNQFLSVKKFNSELEIIIWNINNEFTMVLLCET